ncbi:MAG: beta-ketoacyl-ACP synthase, partial [Pseudomonadota bacterium]
LAFSKMVTERSTRGLTATSYVQMMSHTCAVNVGLFFGVKGRLIPTSSACTSASQAIGYGYESIKHGNQKAMITGGGEELCPTEAAVFDTLFATSTKNSEPNKTPSPYDKSRDGLVIGEGAATLILEELEHAKARGVPIFAELVGFGTCCDAQHITHPDAVMMQAAMELAIKDAGIHPDEVGYVSGHATATDRGDIAESLATSRVFKRKIPISSMKGHFGHTLGACGSIEAWLAIEMMNRNLFSPTLNLKEPDPLCAPLDYIMGGWRNINTQYIMSNNFGFGGINTSLVFKRWNG